MVEAMAVGVCAAGLAATGGAFAELQHETSAVKINGTILTQSAGTGILKTRLKFNNPSPARGVIFVY